jgi:hypothetical protein
MGSSNITGLIESVMSILLESATIFGVPSGKYTKRANAQAAEKKAFCSGGWPNVSG